MRGREVAGGEGREREVAEMGGDVMVGDTLDGWEEIAMSRGKIEAGEVVRDGSNTAGRKVGNSNGLWLTIFNP